MDKREIAVTDGFDRFCQALGGGGALLVSLDRDGKPNPMTIGWALLGIVWGRPICAVMVRPSRYTYGCMEATGDFTVNIPPPEMADDVMFCGTESGREYDKFEECGLTAEPGRRVKSPSIGECEAVWECVVVQKNDVVPEAFIPEIAGSFYASGDYHRVYYGEVVASYADPERWCT